MYVLKFAACFLLNCQIGLCQYSLADKTVLKTNFSITDKLNMSEIFSNIDYIPLETTKECLIGYMNIPIFGEDIIIRSYNNGGSIYRFSEQGKFLNKIGSIGRGPGEYQDFCDVKLIENNIVVVSNFSNNILYYKLSGDFINEYHVNINARPKSVVQLPDKSFMISLSNPSDIGILLKTDRDFNIRTGYKKDVPLNDNPLAASFQKTNSKIYYYYNYIDTIFDISNGYPLPSIIIDYGNFKKSSEKFSIYDKDNTILSKPRILDFSASDDYLYVCIYYPFKNKVYSILYRISDGKQFTWTNLINDLDYGILDRWTGFISGNKLVFWLMPQTIIDRFKSMSEKEKSDRRSAGFMKMASKITPESNPVLMICKLK